MELKSLTYLIVGASFVLYIGIAIWSRAHNTKEFYVAGKNCFTNSKWNGYSS